MAKQKILIVDDDPDLRQALRVRLRASHYETVNAADGYSAIAQAYKERPDLIILDLGLPAGDGFVVLDRLQRDDKLSTIPVVVLTAQDPQSSEGRALGLGAAAFFQKPAVTFFTPEREAVRQEVNAWIRGSGAFDGVADFDLAVRDPTHPAQPPAPNAVARRPFRPGSSGWCAGR